MSVKATADDYAPTEVRLPNDERTGASRRVIAAAAGGGPDAGHTVLVDDRGDLWACGCDRWQQLGLGSSLTGAAGYTWQGGRLWQPAPRLVGPLGTAGRGSDPFVSAACGADYTVAVTRAGVAWGWGRSHLGQASGGRSGPFVAGPKPIVGSAPPGEAVVRVQRALTSPQGDCTVLVHDLTVAAALAAGRLQPAGTRSDSGSGSQPAGYSTHGRCPLPVLRVVLSHVVGDGLGSRM